MPLYEFMCAECGKEFELLVGFSKADDPQTCPTCGSKHSQRKVSSFAMGGSSSGGGAISSAPVRSPFLERVPARLTVCRPKRDCSQKARDAIMQLESPDAKNALKTRLRRVEGQMRGVQKMVDDDRDCQEILQQLAAIRSAVQNASEFFLRTYAKECLTRAGDSESINREQLIEDVMRLMVKIR